MNHFLAVQRGDHSDYLVAHSGSRNVGLQVAQIYQKVAQEHCAANVPDSLKWLEGQDYEDYLHDALFCGRWADRNREAMLDAVCEFAGLEWEDEFLTTHNYINEEGVVRKGAVSAKFGEPLIVPFNMRDGSVIASGLGNPDWNESAPHGAGRLLSRSKAFKTLDVDKFAAEMVGVHSSTVGAATLDEAPEVYKSAEDIIRLIAPTAHVEERLHEVYNFKDATKKQRRGKRE